ncbi:hypothetical protein [Nocardioides abyssi]|uniref:Replication restart DNA helicase PriA n=1 Tax=Nocardioides abyssi TaxID=3058370 RepID=A0ABT8EZ91_9ACTN|nr:hypothetical protein [Nocardioides abyssi]MDN4163399.1 hypothetical protein [Nocardioides abyssi]
MTSTPPPLPQSGPTTEPPPPQGIGPDLAPAEPAIAPEARPAGQPDPAAGPAADSAAGPASVEPAEVHFSSCPSCGSQLSYTPGTTVLTCGACGASREIETGEDTTVDEHSFDEWLAANAHVRVASLGGQVLRCEGCGAQMETTDLAETCQFCTGHLVVLSTPEGLIAPEAVVPFTIAQAGAQAEFKKWVSSRWFAPSSLKKVGGAHSLKGTYVPHWTFDARTASHYTGKRGDHYYVTRTRTVSDGNGGTRTETYQERHTRWSNASGRVARDFDDVLVPATARLATDRLDEMGPWRLETATAYQPEFLSGYSALRYDVDPQDGSQTARARMAEVIEGDVRSDIGGDEQRISSVDTSYAQVMFKLVLLPLWLASYAHGGKQWQVMVNANTGKVTGERPWSSVKIALAVIAAVILVAVVALLIAQGREDATAEVDHGSPLSISQTVTPDDAHHTLDTVPGDPPGSAGPA